MPVIPKRHINSLISLIVLGLLCGAAHANLEVEHPVVRRTRGVYYLSTHLKIDPDKTLLHALRHGIPVTLDLEIKIINHDSFLFWGGSVAHINQRYRISYHPVLGRYVVEDLQTGVTVSYPSFTRACRALRHLKDIPLVDEALLNPHDHYRLRVRLILHLDDIPHALRWIAGLWTTWRTTGPWVTVSLTP